VPLAISLYRKLETVARFFFGLELSHELTHSLNNLGCRLSDVGDCEGAVAATREAVSLYRKLAAARPEAFEPDLAHSLNNLGCQLGDVGDRDGALAASREAVDLNRKLTAARAR
jgi:tetratricopeptide (TPR) repeat protein